MKVKVKNFSNLLRDESTNAIINTDMTEYQNYLQLKQNKESEKKRILKIENDLDNLKSDISDIKNLILGLYNQK